MKVASLIPLLLLTVFARTSAIAQESNPPFRALTGHTASVTAVAFTPDGSRLLSGSRDNTIRTWNVQSGQCERILKNHHGAVYCIAFSHDGKLMASASGDDSIILWDAKTFEPLKTLTGHTAAVRYVAFSPDDQTLASAGEDRSLRLWDVPTGKLKITRTDHTKRLKTVAYFPDGKTIVTASSDGTILLCDSETGKPRQVLRGHINGVEFCDVSPDDQQLFSGTANVGQVIFWDAGTGKILKNLPKAHGSSFGAEIDSGHYSPDGKLAVSGSKDHTDKFWDTKSFALLHTITGNPGRSESMAFSPDGKLLATGFGGGDSSLRIWDISQWSSSTP